MLKIEIGGDTSWPTGTGGGTPRRSRFSLARTSRGESGGSLLRSPQGPAVLRSGPLFNSHGSAILSWAAASVCV